VRNVFYRALKYLLQVLFVQSCFPQRKKEKAQKRKENLGNAVALCAFAGEIFVA
jgi:hypothetical protein